MIVPRIFFTYWEGNQLSEMHYFTILSILKQNPGISVIIYTALEQSDKLVQWTTGEHSVQFHKTIALDELVQIDPTRVQLCKIDFVTDYGMKNNISCVYKADFTRIAKLYEHGGLWFDMDVLFIKPFPAELFDTDVDVYYYSYQEAIPTGLLLSSPKNKVISMIYEKALDIVKNWTEGSGYQYIGPELWRIYFRVNEHDISENPILHNSICLSKSQVYSFDSDSIHMFFISNDFYYLQDDTFAVHWYNGDPHTKQFINMFDRNSIDPGRSVCCKLLHDLNNM